MRAALQQISGQQFVFIWCPACKDRHGVRCHTPGQTPEPPAQPGMGPSWSFDGNLDAPTIAPSLNVSWTQGEGRVLARCHFVVTNGAIAYQGDCTHPMAGQTVPCPDVDSDGYAP